MTPRSSPLLKNPKLYLILLLFVILIPGCDFKKDKLYSKDEAEIKFIRLCKDEYDLDANTKLIDNTLWIYIPYEKDILQFKANRFPQKTKFSVDYVDGDYKKESFYFEYHIKPLLKSEKSKGYTYGLPEKVSEQFRNLLNLIYRVFFNAEKQPEFYVLVLADIVNGVEVIYTIYGLDLKKAYNNAIASEEYYKRILQDIKGSMRIMRDKTGRHLNYKTISMGQFLADQIVQRIRIRFLGLRSELEGNIEEEILKIISYCLRTYGFQDFWEVILKDLSTGTETVKSLSALEKIKEL
jgi:hypothetical protein